MQVVIDTNAGFCFGVEASVALAERQLSQSEKLYCLGALVHNEAETKRLAQQGLEVIDFQQFKKLTNETVLIRAHGEPPAIYEIAKKNNLKLIDATCPIVKKLQSRVFSSNEKIKSSDGQIVLFGKDDHPEMIGLKGQTEQHAIVLNSPVDLDKIDFTRRIYLFSQTTKAAGDYQEIQRLIKERIQAEALDPESLFFITDSVCKQVSNRESQVKAFAQSYEVVVFVAGKASSNGKVLFGAAHCINPNTFFVSTIEELNPDWFTGVNTVGVTGATSTPPWLLKKIAEHIKSVEP